MKEKILEALGKIGAKVEELGNRISSLEAVNELQSPLMTSMKWINPVEMSPAVVAEGLPISPSRTAVPGSRILNPGALMSEAFSPLLYNKPL